MNINDTFRDLNVGLPEDILRHKYHGDFQSAIRLIDLRLARDDQPQGLRNCLTVQREMMLRTAADYPYPRDEAIAIVRAHIPDFTEEEFDQRVDAGKIGWIYLNGQMRFFNRFFPTMCKAEPAFALRAGVTTYGAESAGKGSKADHLLDTTRRKLMERGELSYRIRIRASVKLKDALFAPGMFLRAHLPLPCACDQQSHIQIEKMSPDCGQIAPEDAPQRTICWEGNWEENTEFFVEYSYTHTARYHDVSKIVPSGDQPGFCTEEIPPHVMFTPYIRQLVADLTEGITDPLEKARRFYDFISLNMKYTFMPAYFTLENIAENCARSFSGDCGVFALLFLTLCRCAGIPAQWQSGFAAEPDFVGGHDWVRFYIAPYGWLYADTSYGTAAVRADNEERRRFYFGNLDPFRMVANNAFQTGFTVEKKHWRADPYDNQVGELESDTKGFDFTEYIRDKQILLCQEL